VIGLRGRKTLLPGKNQGEEGRRPASNYLYRGEGGNTNLKERPMNTTETMRALAGKVALG